MKIILLTIVALFFTSNLSACESDEVTFTKFNVCAKINWITGPVFNQYSSATITLKNNAQYKLNVLPWMVMSGHEHGSRPVTLTTISPDEFLVEKIYFMGDMMGDWFLRLQLLKTNKEIADEVRLKIEL